VSFRVPTRVGARNLIEIATGFALAITFKHYLYFFVFFAGFLDVFFVSLCPGLQAIRSPPFEEIAKLNYHINTGLSKKI